MRFPHNKPNWQYARWGWNEWSPDVLYMDLKEMRRWNESLIFFEAADLYGNNETVPYSSRRFTHRHILRWNI